MIDITYIIIFFGAIFGGIATGLLPGLPSWLAPFLLTPFVSQLGIDHVIMFWMLTVMGSQFFGSIASIMFGIPGENSSIVYINEIRSFSIKDRAKLVLHTANASLIASLIALGIVFISHSILVDMMPIFGTTIAKFIVLWVITVMICLMVNKLWMSVLLFTIGAILVPKANIALPAIFAQINQYTYDLSLINIVVGLMIIPEILNKKIDFQHHIHDFKEVKATRATLWGTGIGLSFGFLPGPTATMSATTAYRYTPGNTIEKVISAEAANNAVVIIGAFLLIYLQIPMSIDAISVFTVITSQGWDIYDDFILKGHATKLFISLAAGLVVIWFLARRSNVFYKWICTKMNNSIWFVLLIAAGLIATDIITGQGSYQLIKYFSWLGLLTAIGIALRYKEVSPLPLIFGFIFGDYLVWTTYQILFYI